MTATAAVRRQLAGKRCRIRVIGVARTSAEIWMRCSPASLTRQYGTLVHVHVSVCVRARARACAEAEIVHADQAMVAARTKETRQEVLQTTRVTIFIKPIRWINSIHSVNSIILIILSLRNNEIYYYYYENRWK